jgi:uncharacterized protein
MTTALPCSLDDRALTLIRQVLARHPAITRAVLFGSRAKGTASPASDVDLAVDGLADDLEAESLASEFEELPLPFRFDVKAANTIRHRPLRDHIDRIGITIYPAHADR